MPDWTQHAWNLLWRAALFLISQLGTTVLAVTVAIGPYLAMFVTKLHHSGWKRTYGDIRTTAKKSLKPGAYVTFSIWFLLIVWAVAATIYNDHNDLVAANQRLSAERDVLKEQLAKVHAEAVAAPRQQALKLYYANRELSGATITLDRSNPDPRVCTTMHVWATMPTSTPDSFGLCGVWMKKPDDAANVTAFTLYLDFSEEVAERQANCRISTEKPEPGYKVSLVCPGWPTPSPTRWTLPGFFGLPIPTKDTKVRIRFDYGNRRAEAAFIIRPPERG